MHLSEKKKGYFGGRFNANLSLCMGTYTGAQAHTQAFYNTLCSIHVPGYTPY